MTDRAADGTAPAESSPTPAGASPAPAVTPPGTAGTSPAATFAATEAHVARQLRLATLPEPVLDALRTNKLSIDQARAFTRARDDKTCLDVLGETLAARLLQSGARDILAGIGIPV